MASLVNIASRAQRDLAQIYRQIDAGELRVRYVTPAPHFSDRTNPASPNKWPIASDMGG